MIQLATKQVADKLSNAGRWSRPVDWLAPPTFAVDEQKISLLCAIHNHGSNYVVLGVGGAYTVDWGDGSAPTNHNSNTKAGKNIAWADAPSGTLTSEGFRQVMVTVTPQAGQQIDSFQMSFFDAGVPTSLSSKVIEAWVSMPYCFTSGANSMFATRSKLLRAAHLLDIGGATGLTLTFGNCYALEEVEIACDTSAVTTVASMFSGCASLRRAPFFDASAVINADGMFYLCVRLVEVPHYDFGNCINFGSAFAACRALSYLPPLEYSKATNVASMCADMTSLYEVGDVDFSAATDVRQLFQRCTVLQRVGTVTMPAATTAVEMFASCSSLKSVAGLVVGAGLTSAVAMFYGCQSLREVPLFDTSHVTAISYFVNSAYSLIEIPAFDLSAATTATDWSDGMYQLARFRATGMGQTFTLANCLLQATELNEVYTNLPVVVGKTITVTGNPGTTGDDPSIATAKGWTVTG